LFFEIYLTGVRGFFSVPFVSPQRTLSTWSCTRPFRRFYLLIRMRIDVMTLHPIVTIPPPAFRSLRLASPIGRRTPSVFTTSWVPSPAVFLIYTPFVPEANTCIDSTPKSTCNVGPPFNPVTSSPFSPCHSPFCVFPNRSSIGPIAAGISPPLLLSTLPWWSILFSEFPLRPPRGSREVKKSPSITPSFPFPPSRQILSTS